MNLEQLGMREVLSCNFTARCVERIASVHLSDKLASTQRSPSLRVEFKRGLVIACEQGGV